MALTRKTFVCELFDETPGALRYRELDSQEHLIKGGAEGAVGGDIYVRKAALNGERPTRITVSIEY